MQTVQWALARCRYTPIFDVKVILKSQNMSQFVARACNSDVDILINEGCNAFNNLVTLTFDLTFDVDF